MHPDATLRRITTWMAIFGYMLVASGLPLPAGRFAPTAPESPAAKRLVGKDRSRPFPCMDKPCGCATAEQCFTDCCCNGPAETLAWAKARSVAPDVVAALERRVSGGGRAVAKATNSSCCSTQAFVVEESCCKNQPSATCERPADCGTSLPEPDAKIVGPGNPGRFQRSAKWTKVMDDLVDGQPEAVVPAEQPPEVEQPTRAVTLRAMLACGGIVAEWFAAGAALPPTRVDVCLAMRVVDVCTPGDESGDCLRSSPAAPPPRAA